MRPDRAVHPAAHLKTGPPHKPREAGASLGRPPLLPLSPPRGPFANGTLSLSPLLLRRSNLSYSRTSSLLRDENKCAAAFARCVGACKISAPRCSRAAESASHTRQGALESSRPRAGWLEEQLRAVHRLAQALSDADARRTMRNDTRVSLNGAQRNHHRNRTNGVTSTVENLK